MVTYVLVALVVLAAVVFFLSRKKRDTPDFDKLPDTSHSPAAPATKSPASAQDRSSTSGRGESSSAKQERTAATADSEAPGTSTAGAPITTRGSSEDLDGQESVESDLDSSLDDELSLAEEDEAGSPPPPPARQHTASVPPVSLGRKANLASLRKGLAKSRQAEGLFGKLRGLLGGRKEIDPAIAEEIEEVLLTSDVGVHTTEVILDRIKEQLSRGDLKNEAQVWEALREEARRILSVDGRSGGIVAGTKPTVVLLVGVNGAGKTTTIGKLAAQFSGSGKKVMLAAGDTFRAAAVDQLKAWGQRVGCEVVSGKENADPSSVLFDAVTAAKDTGADILLADTAGRLHTKSNLMQEMAKIEKTAGKALEGAPHEVLLVIDSTNGQNAMAQAKEFQHSLNLTGLILTKLDGTARGGAVLGICDALKLPVRYIGVGERTEDLYEFDIYAFVEALLGSDDEHIAA